MVLNLGPLAPDATALTTRQSFLGSSCFSIKFNSESEPRKCQSKEGKDDVGRDKKCFLMPKNCGRLCFVSEAGQDGKKVFVSFEKLFFFKMMPKRDGSACWRFFCRRPCLSKPIITPGRANKVTFSFYPSTLSSTFF